MRQGSPLAGVDVVVLAGGLGTRISAVLKDTPKLLAPIGDKPFLVHLAAWVGGFGARRLVLCLGHLADKVTAYLDANPLPGMETAVVIETTPQGTAGALRLAQGAVTAETALIMNGDSWLRADLGALAARHHESGAPATILTVRVPDAGRFGAVSLDAAGRIAGFSEKDPNAGPGLINGGVYAVGREFWRLLGDFPGPSLERDVFQRLPSGTLAAYDAGDVPFIDIGTPESLERAREVIEAGGRP